MRGVLVRGHMGVGACFSRFFIASFSSVCFRPVRRVVTASGSLVVGLWLPCMWLTPWPLPGRLAQLPWADATPNLVVSCVDWPARRAPRKSVDSALLLDFSPS